MPTSRSEADHFDGHTFSNVHRPVSAPLMSWSTIAPLVRKSFFPSRIDFAQVQNFLSAVSVRLRLSSEYFVVPGRFRVTVSPFEPVSVFSTISVSMASPLASVKNPAMPLSSSTVNHEPMYSASCSGAG